MQQWTTRDLSLSGFRSTGICPFNPDIFSDDEFEPSAVTDSPRHPDRHPCHLPHSALSLPLLSHSLKGWTRKCLHQMSTVRGGSAHEEPESVSPENIIPFPKVSSARGEKRCMRLKTRILTYTPEKIAVERAHQRKTAKEVSRKS